MAHYNNSRRAFLGKSSVAIAAATLLPSASAFANFIDDTPFEGYNPYAETTSDLRRFHLTEESIKVHGKLWNSDLNPVAHAKMEVWHLSPGSGKYRHRGQFTTDEDGTFEFITDFPNHLEGKKPRIYFKASAEGKSVFTELLLDSNQAYVTGTHWEQNQKLKERAVPHHTKDIFETQIEFNFIL